VNGWQPSVSVVVPAYNAAATIDDCVRSLLELRYPRELLELRVVDNASNDRTDRALRSYGERIIVTQELRRGPAAARNAGVRAGVGDVIAFTDADCTVEPDWLAHLVDALEDPGVGVAGGSIRARAGANQVERYGEEIHDHRKAIELYSPPYAITMSWASRRDVVAEVGGFDEGLRRGEDVDLSYRIFQSGYKLSFVPDAVVYHRNEGNQLGLFREGFQHGFYGVQVRKRHDVFLSSLGHRHVNRRAYADVADGLWRWARRDDDVNSRCGAVFGAGKKAGKLAGSIRFGHLDL
jgi:GT2 family glycosyltransferase